MASGEQTGHHSDPSAEHGSMPGNGQSHSGPRRVLNEINVITPHISDMRVNCSSVDVRGPLFFNMNPFNTHHQRPDVDDQALWDIPAPEDMSHHFTDAQLNRPVEEIFLSFAANACDERANWRRLARKLKLDGPSVSRLEYYYSGHIREFVYQLLLTWKRRHPEVKVRDLVKMLSESKLQKSALELKRYFTSIHGSD